MGAGRVVVVRTELPAPSLPNFLGLVNLTRRKRSEPPSIGAVTWLLRSGDGWVPEDDTLSQPPDAADLRV